MAEFRVVRSCLGVTCIAVVLAILNSWPCCVWGPADMAIRQQNLMKPCLVVNIVSTTAIVEMAAMRTACIVHQHIAGQLPAGVPSATLNWLQQRAAFAASSCCGML